MSRRIKQVLVIGLIGVLVFLAYDWKRKRIDFSRERLPNNWYRYSNDKFTFHYPGKLRNCYECPFNKDGGYISLTDGNYLIMYVIEYAESSMVNPTSVFTYPITNEIKEVRDVIDSILVNNDIIPSDEVVSDYLIVHEIDYNTDDGVMSFQMEIMETPIAVVLGMDDLAIYSAWNNWSLDKRNDGSKKFNFGSYGGRLFLQKEDDKMVLEVSKINRTYFLYPDDSYKLSREDMFRVFQNTEFVE